MKSLPYDLTEPIHILGPSPWPTRFLIGGLLLLATLAWVLWRQRQRKDGPVASPRPKPPPPPTGDLVATLAALRRRYLESERYRDGCHELSVLLRGHLARSEGRPYSFMTAREIGVRSTAAPWVSLVSLVAELQFQRRSPGRGDFDGICDIARDVASLSAGGER